MSIPRGRVIWQQYCCDSVDTSSHLLMGKGTVESRQSAARCFFLSQNMLHRYLEAKRKNQSQSKENNMPKTQGKYFQENRYAVSINTPLTLHERIAGGAKHVYASTIDLRARVERPRTLLWIAREESRRLNSFQLSGIGPMRSFPFRPFSCHQFWGRRPFYMLDPVRCLLPRTGSSRSGEGHLKEEVGDEEAQQAEQRNNLYRDATSVGCLGSKAILGSALLSATCHVPLAQARGCLLL